MIEDRLSMIAVEKDILERHIFTRYFYTDDFYMI